MKKFNQAITTLIFTLTCPLVMAQSSVVLKCTDSKGNITYSNEKTPELTCEKTDINKKVMQITNIGGTSYAPGAKSSSTSVTSNAPSSIPNVTSEEQKKKDQNRISILQKELKDEEDSILKVEKMITNAGEDKEQINQLKDLKSRHSQNIESLRREINLQGKK